MPFGLKNAPNEFQNIMNDIFNPFSHFTIVYINDVLIFSKSIGEHWKYPNAFLETIRHNGLVVSASKIKLFQTKIRFLGFDISEEKIRPIDRAMSVASFHWYALPTTWYAHTNYRCLFHDPYILIFHERDKRRKMFLIKKKTFLGKMTFLKLFFDGNHFTSK